jgi:hypothetical protein
MSLKLGLTLREGHRLGVFENRVLSRIFGNKREEVAGGWGRLHKNKIHNLYPLLSIINVIKSRRMRCAEHGENLVRKAEGKRPLGRHRRRQKDNIRMDRREIGWQVVNWIHLA